MSEREALLAWGFHAVGAALRSGRVQELLLDRRRRDTRMRRLAELASGLGVVASQVSAAELDRLAGAGHQGVVARLAPRPADARLPEDRVGPSSLFLALDGVTDPRNLGACLRSADAFGVELVLLPRDRSAALTPVARKAAAGAAESVEVVHVTNLARSLRALADAGMTLLGAAGEADVDLPGAVSDSGPLCWVLGAEGGGLRRLTRACCHRLVRIPMCGGVESLNVSVATALVLYETRRGWGMS